METAALPVELPRYVSRETVHAQQAEITFLKLQDGNLRVKYASWRGSQAIGDSLRRKPEVNFADVQACIANLALFDLPTLAAMSRIDRFEASDVGSSSEGPKPKHAISDPVGSRVIAKLSGRKVSDPVGSAVKEIEAALFRMRRETDILRQQLAFVMNPRERHKDNVIIYCEACGREVAGTANDRLRSGFCLKDYRDWLGQGKPNRTQFCISVKESLAA